MCAFIIFSVRYVKENIFCSVYGLSYFTPLVKIVRGVIISLASICDLNCNMFQFTLCNRKPDKL